MTVATPSIIPDRLSQYSSPRANTVLTASSWRSRPRASSSSARNVSYEMAPMSSDASPTTGSVDADLVQDAVARPAPTIAAG
jgi:hypothetical protein